METPPNFQEEIARWSEVIAREPHNAEAHFARGYAYLRSYRYALAIQDFDRALEIDANLAEAYRQRGRCYLRTQCYEQALADFDRLIELNPQDAYAYGLRGTCYLRRERYEQATRDFFMAARLSPEDPGTLYDLATVFALRDDLETALDLLRGILEREPEYREYAKYDPSLANLRGELRFWELVEATPP